MLRIHPVRHGVSGSRVCQCSNNRFKCQYLSPHPQLEGSELLNAKAHFIRSRHQSRVELLAWSSSKFTCRYPVVCPAEVQSWYSSVILEYLDPCHGTRVAPAYSDLPDGRNKVTLRKPAENQGS